MPTHPYLHFQGNCADAMAFYAKVFGGADLQLMRYSDMPGGDSRPGAANLVMHSQISLGDGTLMASDYPPGTEGAPQEGFSIMQVAKDKAEAKGWFDALCEGGTVIAPFGPTFFSPAFGMLRDQYGTAWIISCLPGS